MKAIRIQAIWLFMLIGFFGNTHAADLMTNSCVYYAFKAVAQSHTNNILSCGFQGPHWNDNLEKNLHWCDDSRKIMWKVYKERAQLIFNCLDEPASDLTKSESEMSPSSLDNALLEVIKKDDKKGFVRLLATGADLERDFGLNDKYLNNYYFYSLSHKSNKIIKLLEEHGARPSRFYIANKILFDSTTDFLWNGLFENHELLELFFSRDLDLNLSLSKEKQYDSFLALALYKAVYNGALKATRFLLKEGANPNFITIKTNEDTFRSPLGAVVSQVAISPIKTSYELVKELLDYGAYPNFFPTRSQDVCDDVIYSQIEPLPLDWVEFEIAYLDIIGKNPEKVIEIANLLKKAGAISLDDCQEKKDILIAKVAVKYNGLALKYTSDAVKKNKEIVLAAVKQNGMALEFADSSLQKNKTIVLSAVINNGEAYKFVDESLKQQKCILLQAATSYGWLISDIEDKYLDKEIVLAAIKNQATVITQINKKYQDDNDIVTAAGLRKPYEVNDIETQPINNKSDMLKLLKNGVSLKLANDKLRDDRALVLAAIEKDPRNIEYASKRLKNDKDVIFSAFKGQDYQFRNASKQLKNNKDFVLQLVSINGEVLEYASNQLKHDKEVVLAAIKQNGNALEFADDLFKKDHNIVVLAVTKNGTSIKFADDLLKKDRQIIIAAVKQDGAALEYIDPQYKKDKEIVILAVKNYSYALNYADKALKADREVVLEAVKYSGYALQYADKQLMKDQKIVLAAIKNYPSIIKYAHESLFNNRAFILKVLKYSWLPSPLDFTLSNDSELALQLVKSNGLQLKNLSKKIQSDKAIVLLAVKNNGLALKYADPKLQKDPEIVSVAIQQNILALKYVNDPLRQNRQWILDYIKKTKSLPKWINKELRQDKSFIHTLLENKINALIYASPELLKDKALVLSAVKADGMALRYADNSLKKDKEVVLTAVKKEAEAFQYADEQLFKNKKVVLDAIKLNGRAYYFASKKLQSDLDVILAALKQKINVLKLLSDQEETSPWLTDDTGYSIKRINLEKPLVLKNLARLTQGNFVFSPDGLLFAAAAELSSGRAQVKIWSTENAKLLYSTIVPRLPHYNYQGLVFSPDSKRLIYVVESDSGFIWNFHQGEEPFSCGTGTELIEINSQTQSMLTNPADAPLGLFSLENCENLGYSPEFITTSPYVISPDNEMIIRDNTFINNNKYEQMLIDWDSKKNKQFIIHYDYIHEKNLWEKTFDGLEKPLGNKSYYPDYKTRKYFYLDKKHIWIIDIDTGELIKKLPLPKNSILTKLATDAYTYSFEQPFVISSDNKIMVIDGGEKSTVESISLETGKILHTINVFSGNINIPPPAPEGVRDFCPTNNWGCLFDIKTSVSPNGQFIQYGRDNSSSMFIDSQNEKLILKLPSLVRSKMSESKTGETMFVSMERANVMTLWKIKKATQH